MLNISIYQEDYRGILFHHVGHCNTFSISNLCTLQLAHFTMIHCMIQWFNVMIQWFNVMIQWFNLRIQWLNPQIESLNHKIESLNHNIESLNPKIEWLNHRVNHWIIKLNHMNRGIKVGLLWTFIQVSV
jgi:hypothetical protein